MPTYALRISCPDRPGTLGAVASGLGAIGLNIVSLDVLERSSGLAVDQLVVDGTAPSMHALIDAVEAVVGVVVELVHTVQPDGGQRGGLDLAAALVTGHGVLDTLCASLPEAFAATWCAVVKARAPQPLAVRSSALAPSLVGARTPWLPAEHARRLDVGAWVPDRWPLDPLSASFALAPLSGPDEALLVARTRGPVFRQREVDDLANVARIAGALLERDRGAAAVS